MASSVPQRAPLGIDTDLLYRALDQAQSFIVISDANAEDQPVVWANSYFCTYTGYTTDEVIGQNCRFLQADDRNQPGRYVLRQAVEDGGQARALLRNYKKSGDLFLNEVHLAPVSNEDGQVTHFIGVQSDVSARVTSERRRADRFEDLLEQSERAQSEAGARIQNDLGQAFAGARLYSAALEHDLVQESHPLAGDAARLNAILSRTVTESFAVAQGLNPVGSGPDALHAALAQTAAKLGAGDGPNCHLHFESGEVDDDRVARHLYRLAEEALRNAVRHSNADRVDVRLFGGDGEPLVLEVCDDGKGLPGPIADAPETSNGLGFHAMQFRADLIDGDLHVTSDENAGTCIRCIVPV